MDEDIKIMPISIDDVKEKPSKYPKPTPATKGIELLMVDNQPMSDFNSLKLSNLVSRPAMNIRKMSPI